MIVESILIDHTRAFTTDKSLVHKKFGYVDGALWDKMQALTLERLTTRLATWVGQGELKAVLERRDRMKAEFDKQMAANPDFVIK